MTFNYSKLNGKIVEIFGSRGAFAKAMGWSMRTTSLKLNNKVSWTQKDISKACVLLNLTANQIDRYFFDELVQFDEPLVQKEGNRTEK